jgi:hypothetical protein
MVVVDVVCCAGSMAVPELGADDGVLAASLAVVLGTTLAVVVGTTLAPRSDSEPLTVSASVDEAAAEEAAVGVLSTTVWVKRLNRLVLSSPTPTAGTVPSSFPVPNEVATATMAEVVCGMDV